MRYIANNIDDDDDNWINSPYVNNEDVLFKDLLRGDNNDFFCLTLSKMEIKLGVDEIGITFHVV